MNVSALSISEVLLIAPKVFADDRGFFVECWQKQRYEDAGINFAFVQENHSQSSKGVLRGLHYQMEPVSQGKLIRIVRGEIFDVAVDMRESSPTFGHWVGTRLSEGNKHQLWIPPGFAHGFLTLSDRADLIYKCTDYYAPSAERVVRWDDELLGIDWPIDPDSPPTVSARDAEGVAFSEADYFA